MNLYQIAEELERLIESATDLETGEINADAERAFDRLNMEFDRKVENYGLFIKNLDADIKAIDEEIKRLQARKKTKQNKVNFLKNTLTLVLGGQPFETPRVRIGWRPSKQVIINTAESEFDLLARKYPDYFKEVIEYKPDKNKIKKDIEQGNKLPFATLIEKINPQIK